MLSHCKHLLIALLFITPRLAPAQNKNLVQQLVATIDSFNNQSPTEKVFLQTDRPYYSTNDTVWMKGWVLDAGLNFSKQSGLLYIELINDTGKVVISQSMPVRFGISFGQMILDERTVTDGSYTLRAYTNWMQNQGEQSFFSKQIYIANTSDNPWLISSDYKITNKQDIENVQAVLKLNKVNLDPVRLKELQLRIKDGDRMISKENVQTDLSGKLDINFNLPDNVSSKHLAIIAQDLSKGETGAKLIIPVTLNRPENVDIQFLPEGGNLVAGLPALIGFKAIGEDGKGIDIRGQIIDSKGAVITGFASQHKGIGSFNFTAKLEETYMARISLPDGKIKTYPLPQGKTTGITIHISNLGDKDSLLLVTINASPDILKTDDRYMLIAQSGGKLCYAANVSFSGDILHGTINKTRFMSGITRFTLFNTNHIPIAERLAYIDHHDELKISLAANNPFFKPKDSITLALKVTDNNNRPVMGSFALVVTDNEQISPDSSNVPDIKSYMLLCGDLKGNVEDPGYYFDGRNANKDEALDNLLITQGWIGYNWNNVFNPKYQPVFKAEPEIEVTGQISRAGNKHLGSLPVTLLFTKKPVLVRETISDSDGHFVFKNLPRIDTANFILQVKDQKGKMFEANINVDEFIPAKVTQLPTPLKPWYVNSDSTLLNYFNKDIAYQQAEDHILYPSGTRHLKQVVVKGLKTVKGSHFFAGYGAVPDVVLDEADMRKANKMTIEELLTHKIKGFTSRPYPCKTAQSLEYTIGCNPIVFFIDGFHIDEFYSPQPGFTDHYEYIKSFIGAFTAEDVRGIEEKDEKDYSIIEITTWSGNGAFMKRTHGSYLYRPMPVTWPKQFYKPKYTAKSSNPLADLRPTVYWEPNIITDTAGKATVGFYAKGKPGGYHIILQGGDLNGHVGTETISLKVK
jgi:hypothetical protein